MTGIHLQLLVIFSATIYLVLGTAIYPISPPELVTLFKEPIKVHLSPIGYRPLVGRLQGLVILAEPIGACTKLTEINSKNEEIFILTDDTECLQSIKAKNIADSGGYVGLIKQNINNTLHDKEIKLVHIPIIEIKPSDYDLIQKFIKDNPDERIAISIDFTDTSQTHPINVEFWFSPTQQQSYEFLLQNKDFLLGQSQFVDFSPHYVLQSQRQTKNYMGCLSSGRYCPTQIEYEGKYEGKNIVQQTLRQIIIWDLSPQKWWRYIEYFYKNCILVHEQIFKNSTKLNYCTQNSEILASIDHKELKSQYKDSFLGSRIEVDDNTYLLQERQLYIREQISSHPIVLINKKQIQVDSGLVRNRICKMQGESPSSDCKSSKSGLSTKQMLIILFILIGVFVTVAALYRVYINISMRRQIKSEVDKTLEQYYRYIQTFEGQNGEMGGSTKGKKKQKYKTLNEEMEEVEQSGVGHARPNNQIQIQMKNVGS